MIMQETNLLCSPAKHVMFTLFSANFFLFTTYDYYWLQKNIYFIFSRSDYKHLKKKFSHVHMIEILALSNLFTKN